MRHDNEAAPADKRRVLDEFTRLMGYHPRYALSLFTHPTERRVQPPASPCSRRYDAEEEEALVVVWNSANRPCGKLLIPFVPTLVNSLERHGHLHLSEHCQTRLLSLSAATADRLLRPHR